MIRLILVRHGRRLRQHHGHLDPLDPLHPSSRGEVDSRARELSRVSSRPTRILTSRHLHARETASRLAAELGVDPAEVRDAAFLTPTVKGSPWYESHRADQCEVCRGRPEGASDQAWYDQADAALRESAAGVGAGGDVVIVWVGHETRLSQLVLRFSGTRRRQLEALDAVCLEAADASTFAQGNARIAWQYPVRNWLEADIKAKLTSKMTVATLLASANFVAMSEILINKPQVLSLDPLNTPVPVSSALGDLIWLATHGVVRSGPPPTLGVVSGHLHALAFLCFGVAAALFVSTVYLYDRLAMPDGFWTLRPPREAGQRSASARELAALHGAPYFHMVRIWRRVFTPAVALSFLGTLVLVLSLGAVTVASLFAALFILVLVWYRHHLPSGYVD
jgi:phosphohistidine phosphatase SixA